MGRFKAKEELISDIIKERKKLETLLESIPSERKSEEVCDGMNVKDFLAHRTEWGRMMIHWYEESKKGEIPAVPSEKYKWNQLKALNAEIFEQYKNDSLKDIESEFKRVHDLLYEIIDTCGQEELFSKNYHTFAGTSDLASYFNSATAAHYRSATKYIKKWWKERSKTN